MTESFRNNRCALEQKTTAQKRGISPNSLASAYCWVEVAGCLLSLKLLLPYFEEKSLFLDIFITFISTTLMCFRESQISLLTSREAAEKKPITILGFKAGSLAVQEGDFLLQAQIRKKVIYKEESKQMKSCQNYSCFTILLAKNDPSCSKICNWIIRRFAWLRTTRCDFCSKT